MIGPRPKFIDSPYFVEEPGNWHLKKGAPPEVAEEYKGFMEALAIDDVPLGLDLVDFVPDYTKTWEENEAIYRDKYYEVYGEYPPDPDRE